MDQNHSRVDYIFLLNLACCIYFHVESGSATAVIMSHYTIIELDAMQLVITCNGFGVNEWKRLQLIDMPMHTSPGLLPGLSPDRFRLLWDSISGDEADTIIAATWIIGRNEGTRCGSSTLYPHMSRSKLRRTKLNFKTMRISRPKVSEVLLVHFETLDASIHLIQAIFIT